MSTAHSVRAPDGAWICSRHPTTGGWDERGPLNCLRCHAGRPPDEAGGSEPAMTDAAFAAAMGLAPPPGDALTELFERLGLNARRGQ